MATTPKDGQRASSAPLALHSRRSVPTSRQTRSPQPTIFVLSSLGGLTCAHLKLLRPYMIDCSKHRPLQIRRGSILVAFVGGWWYVRSARHARRLLLTRPLAFTAWHPGKFWRMPHRFSPSWPATQASSARLSAFSSPTSGSCGRAKSMFRRYTLEARVATITRLASIGGRSSHSS